MMAELDAGAGGRLDDHFCSVGHCSIHWFRVRWARMSARYAELQFRIGQSQNESESSVASVVFRVRCLDLTSKMLDQFRMCRDTIRAHTRHAYTNHRMHRIQTPSCWHTLRGITHTVKFWSTVHFTWLSVWSRELYWRIWGCYCILPLTVLPLTCTLRA